MELDEDEPSSQENIEQGANKAEADDGPTEPKRAKIDPGNMNIQHIQPVLFCQQLLQVNPFHFSLHLNYCKLLQCHVLCLPFT